jgi:hypothetical protein
MSRDVQDARPAGTRGPWWRAVQLILGVALFLYGLRVLTPLPIERGPYVLLAAMLGAGAMGLSDAVVGLVATIFDKLQKGTKA